MRIDTLVVVWMSYFLSGAALPYVYKIVDRVGRSTVINSNIIFSQHLLPTLSASITTCYQVSFSSTDLLTKARPEVRPRHPLLPSPATTAYNSTSLNRPYTRPTNYHYIALPRS